ncbi:MAG: trigger factor [Defluviimonas sp.]|uniref:DUF6314 family protein n=1 Tax=Albidovulum sp. TaxID=1872424 RepID=UPI001DEA3150|nr:trigger factor [Paracoccaceae bacterium]MCC0064105.1 trigger factor [Defluviimonas sp.]
MPQLQDFEGAWRISRRIDDRRGPAARFDGTAVFSPVAGGLFYRETGLLCISGGGSYQAGRCYLWRSGPAGTIVVDHADGRAFHSFCPGREDARHLCGADDYRVRYDFGDWPRWRAEWRVLGPRKDYLMISHYRPEGQGADEGGDAGADAGAETGNAAEDRGAPDQR